MRVLNVFLCLVVSALLALGVVEAGLRLLGRGPQPTINRFDPVTGWSKTPGARGERTTSEFHASYDINELGLRDDPMKVPGKPTGTLRVLALGDSFVLGYTVDRQDLFVDQLESWWKGEGRNVEVINAGTEGWSTDQEVVWFQKEGQYFAPDVVILFPYENDLFWNSQVAYRRFPKPRFNTDVRADSSNTGRVEPSMLRDPGSKAWYESFAIGATIAGFGQAMPTFEAPGGRKLLKEYGALLHEPPEFMKDALLRTESALIALERDCKRIGSKLYVAPIPGKGAIEPASGRALASMMGTDPKLWSADQPVDTFLALAAKHGIATLDARASLKKAAESEPVYYARDWHFSPHGNRTFARFLYAELERDKAFPSVFAAKTPRDLSEPVAPFRVPTFVYVYAALVLALSAMWKLTYKKDAYVKGLATVAVMLALVFTIALGGGALLNLAPPAASQVLILLFIVGLLGFVLWKLGRRLSTISELLLAFTRRGHWYLMPLVVVLLSIGSLLVVAASSPLVAPFIYTLF